MKAKATRPAPPPKLSHDAIKFANELAEHLDNLEMEDRPGAVLAFLHEVKSRHEERVARAERSASLCAAVVEAAKNRKA